MDSSYYPDQLFDSMNRILPEDRESTYYTNSTPADGLVYNHLQQTLQVQTDLKNQQRIQDFLNNAITTTATDTMSTENTMMRFDELYSSVTSESDMPYLQLMEQATTPFFTPVEPLMDHDASAFNISYFHQNSSAAGLDTGSLLSSQLCHPLSSVPDNFYPEPDHFSCDYFSNDQDMLAGFNCNTFDSNQCINTNELAPSPFIIPPLAPLPYNSPSIHETAASLSAISSDHHMAFRSNSTPLLSTSYSCSSFSSTNSSTQNDDEDEDEDAVPKPEMHCKPTMTKSSATMSFNKKKPPQPRKSASISYIPEQSSRRKKSATRRKNSGMPSRKNTSDSLSYYLSKQRLSDVEDDEDAEYSSTAIKMSTSSSGVICKKGRNVDKACNHCKRSHLRCDNVRPCRRCVATGKVGCQDVKHKPRGRPRLQKRL